MLASVPAWEQSKENVVPSKRGRSIEVLEKVKSSLKTHDIKIGLSEGEKLFESELVNDTNDAQSLLEIYIRYYKWSRDNFPSNHEKSLLILEVSTISTHQQSL